MFDKIKVLLVSLLAGAVLLVLLEAALALFFPDSVRYVNPLAQPAYQFDDETIVGLRPGVERTFFRAEVNGGERIPWRVNSEGYRGNELRKDGTPRIVVYGDSNIQARFSTLDNTYTAQLERKLQSVRGDAVEVINAGVIGFGPDQNLLRMQRELPNLKPELVILQIFADNDYGDLVRNRLFDLSPDNETLRTQYAIEPDQWLAGDRSRRVSRFVRSLLSVRMISRLLPMPASGVDNDSGEAMRNLVRDELAKREAEYAVYLRKSAREISHFADSYDIDVALDPDSDVARTKFSLMRGVLVRAKRVAEANGAQLMVLIQPSVVDMTDTNAALGRSFLKAYPGYRPDTLSNTLAELCKEAGVDALNLYDAFFERDPASLYFRGSNDHWNDAGQAVAADATVQFLSRLSARARVENESTVAIPD